MKTNALVPELYVGNFDRSIAFYRDLLGFEIVYIRVEERFAFIAREGAQLMLEQSLDPARAWIAGDLAYPYGRGINLQIRVSSIEALHVVLEDAGVLFFLPLEDRWYRRGGELTGNRQFIVQDPDGYLLRFYQDLGTKPIMHA